MPPPNQDLHALADTYAEYPEQDTGPRFWLFPRKGGGGRGGGGGKGGSKGGSKGGGGKGAKGRASGSASGSGKVSPSKLNTGRAVSKAASSTSKGGGKKFKLGKSSAFPGRQAGGGTRVGSGTRSLANTWIDTIFAEGDIRYLGLRERLSIWPPWFLRLWAPLSLRLLACSDPGGLCRRR